MYMQTITKMSIGERLDIAQESFALEAAGKKEEALIMRMTKIPLEPWLAKIIKEKVGADFLRDNHYNLTEVEAEFGPDWLDK
jgi:hypothetical protein